MSKRPRRSRHRIPAQAYTVKEPVISEQYQAEVDLSIAKLEQRYRKAEKALAAAEAKAERHRQHMDQLALQQERALRVAETRAAEEQRLTDYIERIKQAAQRARVAEARAKLEQQQRDAIARRNTATALRKAEAKANRDREKLIAASRTQYAKLEQHVAERKREVREIELLMMPTGYSGRDARRRQVRFETGEVLIPLGATTGQRRTPPTGPTFPVQQRSMHD